jgi:hypothetical protein
MKILSLLLLVITTVFITSCDSATPLDTGIDGTKLAKALKQPANGDTIIFTNTDSKPDPFLPEIVLTGLTTTSPNISYVYTLVSDHRFNLDVNNRNDELVSLDLAVNNVIGEPTNLGSRFRELIFREEANFTVGELQEIIDLLNPSGASLFINPDDPTEILASSDRVYRFEIRSNEGDKLIGSMGGVYFVEESSIVVDFREPTPSELNTYRFLTINHKIPFLTGKTNRLQVTERGNFVIDLVNRNNQPR